MRTRPLGKSGIEASVVGLGTWVLGGGIVWGENPDDQESIRTIHAALDAGITLIDTAPSYGFGRSEQVVGQAIAGRRDEVVLATKCGLWWDDDRGSFFTEYDGRQIRRSLRPDTIQIEVERSLKNLGTDYLDLYQTHWQSTDPDKTAIEDTIAYLSKLKDEGKIRAFGACNVSLDELQEYVTAGGIASNQFRYSMLHDEAEAEVLPCCLENQLATLTYMSLEQGLLAGKVGMDRVFSEEEFRSNEDWNPWFKMENRPRILAMLAGWSELTERYRCTLAQLVIAWTVAQEGITHVLCGARRVTQAEENAAAGELMLSEEDTARMRSDVQALGKPA